VAMRGKPEARINEAGGKGKQTKRSTKYEVRGTRRGRGSKEARAEPDAKLIRSLVEAALVEDRAKDDITTNALIPADQRGRAQMLAKSPGVLAGLSLAEAAFDAVDSSLAWQAVKADGERVSPGDTVATVEGSLHSILRAERVALNFVAHLSGIATTAAAVVVLLQGTNCRLRDTRKTMPGLRAPGKYAVRLGGGTNHRMDLGDGILIKDNHLAAVRARLPAGNDYIAEAVSLARKSGPRVPIEIEVTTVEEARRALAAGADELLLDNMSLDAMGEVVALAAKRDRRPALEASGGITVDSARAVAETGVDYISMGAITQSAPALDLSLEVQVV
jgi:nicotinate-nucleotide pyrophosphorylase (carboxylating)